MATTSKGPGAWLWVAAGFVSLGLGVIGALLPILPTTPLVLLAAACFARGSDRAHGWLLRNRMFGPLVERWQRTRSVSLRAKVMAILLLTITLGSTIVFVVEVTWVRVLLAAIGIGVVVFLLRLPTARS